MKSGLIIYVAGNAPQGWSESDEARIRSTASKADLIEIITTETGHFDVLDAWRDFLAKGMSLVICKIAVFSKSGEIEFPGRELKLCG